MVDPDHAAEISSRVARLDCWLSTVSPQILVGGITNTNFIVEDNAEKFVVRVGEDLPLHGILRTHEVQSSQAAHAAGLAPEIVHHESGILVMRYIEGATLTATDVSDTDTLDRLAALLRVCHTEIQDQLSGPTPMFWVSQVCRSYLKSARQEVSRVANQLDRLEALNIEMEEAIGAINPVYCHNDLLPSNFIDDGKKIWLIDWEYAGWNSALFDLANLAANCELSPELEIYLLKTYHGQEIVHQTYHQYRAFKCASLLRETLWSVVQELYSHLDFDYATYTDEQFSRLEKAYEELKV